MTGAVLVAGLLIASTVAGRLWIRAGGCCRMPEGALPGQIFFCRHSRVYESRDGRWRQVSRKRGLDAAWRAAACRELRDLLGDLPEFGPGGHTGPEPDQRARRWPRPGRRPG